MTDEEIKSLRAWNGAAHPGSWNDGWAEFVEDYVAIAPKTIDDLLDAVEQARAELADVSAVNERLKTTRMAWIENETLRAELTLANEVIEAARAMSDAFKLLDDGAVTHETEFQLDNAWERLRELLARHGTAKAGRGAKEEEALAIQSLPEILDDVETFEFANTKAIMHTPANCAGHPCPVHAPSAHHMIAWPLVLRETSLIERLCPHGIGHPDPDSLAHFERTGIGGFGAHGCDGCCDPAGVATSVAKGGQNVAKKGSKRQKAAKSKSGASR